MFCVRGATTIDKDDKIEINEKTKELLESMITQNNIDIKDIISVFFSCTGDIKSDYPAKAARDMGIIHAGLFCLKEMEVLGSLDKCIRILMHINGEKIQDEVNHIYLRKAVNLRPDLKRNL